MKISDNFSGALKFQENVEGYDSFFSINGNLVTLIPLTPGCRNAVNQSAEADQGSETKEWLYGFAEDNCSVAVLKNSRLVTGITSGQDMNAAKFGASVIVKSPAAGHELDLRTFDTMEFFGGIVDLLYPPSAAIDERGNGILYKAAKEYTRSYAVDINGEAFDLEYSVSTRNYFMETGKIPDLRANTHSVVRFRFPTERSLNDFEKYFSYGLRLFQFCTGRQNVSAEVRLYKKSVDQPFLTRISDGFDDYANDELTIVQLIRLSFLRDRLPALVKLLNEEAAAPYMLFLPNRNKDANFIKYTDVGDLCVAFEKEYSLLGIPATQEEIIAAKCLTEHLLAEIEKANACPDSVRTKARNILNSQLKNFSPSLKEKITAIYKQFSLPAKSIVEQEKHAEWGLAKAYSEKDFMKKISEFIGVRNKASHAGVVWNGGEEIFYHLELYVYFSILSRAGYQPQDSAAILSWLFGWRF